MKIIPNESRATMMVYREGRSLEQFLDDMWDRRACEYPCVAKSSGAWPFVRATDHLATVTQLRAKAGAKA